MFNILQISKYIIIFVWLNEIIFVQSNLNYHNLKSISGPFTVFGPTNEAFAALPEALMDELKNNKTLLAEVLKYHVLSGEALSKDLKNEELVASLDGPEVRINIYDDGKVRYIFI